MKTWLSILFVLTFCSLCTSPAAGQIVTRDQIIHTADSILHAYVGDRLFPNFTRRTLIHYAIVDSLGDVWPGQLADTSNVIHGELRYVSVFYDYSFTYPKCPQLPLLSGETYIGLDATFRHTNRQWFAFLPEWMLKNRKCDLISEAEAVRAARKAGIRRNSEPVTAKLQFYTKTKDYVWIVSSGFTGDSGIPGSDLMVIDAITGKVLLRQQQLVPPVDIRSDGKE